MCAFSPTHGEIYYLSLARVWGNYPKIESDRGTGSLSFSLHKGRGTAYTQAHGRQSGYLVIRTCYGGRPVAALPTWSITDCFINTLFIEVRSTVANEYPLPAKRWIFRSPHDWRSVKGPYPKAARSGLIFHVIHCTWLSVGDILYIKNRSGLLWILAASKSWAVHNRSCH